MIRLPTRSTRNDTHFPYPNRFRSAHVPSRHFPEKNHAARERGHTVQQHEGSGVMIIDTRIAASNAAGDREWAGLNLRVLLFLLGMVALWTVLCGVSHRAPDLDGMEELVWASSLELRSEEHTSELQSLMRISYAVFCLKNKNNK